MPSRQTTRLQVMQSLWAMQGLGADGEDWPLARKLDLIVQGGFDGAGIRCADRRLVAEASALLRASGLTWQGICIVRTHDELQQALDLAAEFGADHLDVQADLRPASLDEAVAFVEGALQRAGRSGVPVLFETHRHRLTADPAFTLQLLERVPAMQLAGDLSHYLTGHELTWPMSDEDRALIDGVLVRCGAFHGRVGSRQQIQLPLGFPHLRHWEDLFMAWWEQGLRQWRQRAAPGACFTFLCELGPPEYAITGADGRELSDRWRDARQLMGRMRALWGRLQAETGQGTQEPHDRSGCVPAAAHPRLSVPEDVTPEETP